MKTYRPCVGIALFNNEGLVFAGERVQKRNSWQMPQGGVDRGESVLQAAHREMHEETGVKSASLLAYTDGWLHYEIPSKRGKHRGQKQMWFAFRLEDESQINVAQAHAEFSSHCFLPLSQMESEIISFKKNVYRQVNILFGALCVNEKLLSKTPRVSGEAFAQAGSVRALWA